MAEKIKVYVVKFHDRDNFILALPGGLSTGRRVQRGKTSPNRKVSPWGNHIAAQGRVIRWTLRPVDNPPGNAKIKAGRRSALITPTTLTKATHQEDAMASHDSIRRALLRPGHFLSLHSDRLLYVSPVRSLGGFSIPT